MTALSETLKEISRPDRASEQRSHSIGRTIATSSNEMDPALTSTTVLRGFSLLVRKLGGNPVQLADECGVDHGELCDPAAWISQHGAASLLELAAARLGCPDFGLRLAASQSMSAVLKPLDTLFSTAPTLRDVYQTCGRHMSAYNTSVVMDLDEGSSLHTTFVHLHFIGSLGVHPQLTEMLVCLSHDTANFLSRGVARAREIQFSHLPVGSPEQYSRYFRTAVRFDQEIDGILFDKSAMGLCISESGPDRFVFEEERFSRQYPARLAGTEIHTRLAVFRLLFRHEECTRRNVARLLGVQERTLNRRLAREGTSFEQVRDLVRQCLAYRYLNRDDLSLAEITGKLGYSELAVLSRSCHRWFGAPPLRMRRNLSWIRSAGSTAQVSQRHAV